MNNLIDGFKNNKKTIVFYTVIAMLVFIFYNSTREKTNIPPNDGKVHLILTLKEVKQTRNDSVGNSWSFKSTANGEEIRIKESKELVLEPKETLRLVSTTEEDDSYPDKGVSRFEILADEIKSNEENEFIVSVLTKENKGRYNGNTAVHDFVFKVKRK